MSTPLLRMIWHEDHWPPIHYALEEVTRQGHDSRHLDGIERVGWMLNAWAYALAPFRDGAAIQVEDVVAIGRLIEPSKNREGFRYVNVKTRTPDGDFVFLPFERVEAEMQDLLDRQVQLTALVLRGVRTHSSVRRWQREDGEGPSQLAQPHVAQARVPAGRCVWQSDQESMRGKGTCS